MSTTKVWVVIDGDRYESGRPVAVFFSETEARKFADTKTWFAAVEARVYSTAEHAAGERDAE